MNTLVRPHSLFRWCTGVLLLLVAVLWTGPVHAQQYAFQNTVPSGPDTRFDNPTDVAVSVADSTVYVADRGAEVIFRYGLDGTRRSPLRTVTIRGRSYSLDDPRALDIGPDGTLFIAARDAERIIAVPGGPAEPYVMGTGGGDLGQLDDLRDVTVDESGYIYGFDDDQQYVPYFDDQGRFLSWIRGGARNFEEIRAIGTNGGNEIYVLETEGAAVTVFNDQGEVVSALGRLNNKPGVTIEEPTDMAVLPGGDFLVLDREDGRITHFSQEGSVIGTFGAKGAGGAGTFRDPTHLSVAHGASNHIAVLDAEGKQVQTFRVPARPDTLSAPPRKLSLQGTTSSPRPFVDLVRRPDGRLYYIPRVNRSIVIGQDSSSSGTTIQVDEAQALALGPDRSLFVLDVGTNTIRQYDAEGALVREFGRGLAQELDEPSDIATVGRYVLVSERGRGAIRVWNNEGVYQSGLEMRTGLSEPAAIAANDSSRVYVWDTDRNTIMRGALGGSRFSGSLRLRTEDVRENEGEILGLEVDPLNQVHAFNTSTNQYEIYSWDDVPSPVFRFGRKGEGPFAFDDVVDIDFDDQNFVAHIVGDGGDAISSIQLSVRPPAPSDSPRFRNEGDTLVASVPPIENPAVVEYGLLRTNTDGPPDTVSTQPTPEFHVPISRADALSEVDRYAFVSLSPTNASPPTASFPNYFGLGAHLFAQGRYDDALAAYRRAADSLALDTEAIQFVAQRYVDLGRSLAESYELIEARRYLEAARSYAPSDTVGSRALGFTYGQQLRRLANEERYDSLRTVANSIMEQSDTTQAVRSPILASVDTIASRLQRRPTEAARADASSLYKGLRTWTDTSAQYAYQYASAQWALYQTKRRTGAPSFEQDLALRNTVTAAQTAADRQSAQSPHYHDAHLLLLNALAAQEKYKAVVETATRELQNKTAPLQKPQRTAYRKTLAQAYRGQGKYKLAIREYRKLVSTAPKNKEYKLALADVLVENESYAKAKTLYQELRTQNPKDARLVARIGELELQRGNFSEASLQLEKALNMNPDLTGVRGLLGNAYDGASNYSKAIDAYRAAVKEIRRGSDSTQTSGTATLQTKAPTDRLSSYLQSLGRLHMQIGQYSAAAGAYKQLTEVSASNAAAWHGLGQAFMQSGRVYEALDALNRALTLEKTSKEISKDLSRARSLRDQISENRPPIEIVDTNVDELYPSLYKNYSDASRLPIGTVVLANNTNVPKPNATLTFYVEGLMDEPTEQKMKPLSSYSNTTIPLRAVFNESILQTAEQKTMQARLRLTYRHQAEAKIVEKTVSFTMQSRNAIKWKDKRRLAAFISPRDPQLIDYTKSIDRLFRDEPTYDLPTNVVTGIRIFSVLTNQGYTYSVDPQTDFSVVSRNPEMLDYCQYPEQTIMRKAGDCDDLVTLYLSMLANAGVSTGYVDIPGHVMSAFDTGLSPNELKGSALSREDVVISQDNVWIPVETTLLGSESFLTAWRKGIERYRKEQKEGDLPQIISISNARSVYEPSSIKPDSFKTTFSDTSAVLSEYRDQVSTLYARQTEAERNRLSKQLQDNPKNTYVRNRLGILYARGGKHEKARQLYQEGLNLTPTNALLLNNFANVLYHQERYSKAVDLYKRSLNSGEEDPQIYINLCKAQLALGRSKQAASSFQTAIQKDPSLSKDYSYLQKQL